MVKVNLVNGNTLKSRSVHVNTLRHMKDKRGIILPSTTKIFLTWKVNIRVVYYRISKWKAPR